MRRIISMFVVFTLLFTITGVSYAEEKKADNGQVEIKEIENVVEQFLNEHFEKFVTLQHSDKQSNLIEDNMNTYAFEIFKRQNIELYKEFDIKYEWFKLKPNFKKISVNHKQAQVEMILDMDYQLDGVDVESGMYNVNFSFDLKNKDGIWQIVNIDSDYDLFKYYKDDLIKEAKITSFAETTKQDIDEFYIKRLKEIKDLKQQTEDNNVIHIDKNTDENTDVVSQRTYSYSGWVRGASYANRFVGGSGSNVGESRIVESPHPYPNNYSNTWTISKPGAVSIRVHFSKIDTERNRDYVKTDAGDTFTGSHNGIWSRWKKGSNIKVTLESNSSVTDWGFKIDKIDYRYFYTAREDCTNFVSQCIWAAYGGYVSGDDSKTRSNISKKVRMVDGSPATGWFGGPGGGSESWESVEHLWDFATNTSKTYGPKATGSNNNAVYSNISPRAVTVGDVLQFYYPTEKEYTHSVYVTYKPSSNVKWNNILVCQHSSDVKNRPVIDLINLFGGSRCKMRRMKFLSASFKS